MSQQVFKLVNLGKVLKFTSDINYKNVLFKTSMKRDMVSLHVHNDSDNIVKCQSGKILKPKQSQSFDFSADKSLAFTLKNDRCLVYIKFVSKTSKHKLQQLIYFQKLFIKRSLF